MEKHLFTCKDCGSHDLVVAEEDDYEIFYSKYVEEADERDWEAEEDVPEIDEEGGEG